MEVVSVQAGRESPDAVALTFRVHGAAQTVRFEVLDAQGTPLGAPTLRPAPGAAPITDEQVPVPSDALVTLYWDAAADLGWEYRREVKLRATPQGGSAVETAAFEIGNDPPALATLELREPYTGNLFLACRVSDNTSDTVDLQVWYSRGIPDGELVAEDDPRLRPATVLGAVTDVAASPAGSMLSFSWDTEQDLGRAIESGIRLHVQARDGFSYRNGSALFSSAGFTVDNNDPPSAAIDGMPEDTGAVQGIVPIQYRLYDRESNPVAAALEYSVDNGFTWQPATEFQAGEGPAELTDGTIDLGSSPFDASDPVHLGGTPHRFLWDTCTDFGARTQEQALLRLTAGDGEVGPPLQLGGLVVDNCVVPRAGISLPIDYTPADLAVADFNGDGKADVACAHYDAGSLDSDKGTVSVFYQGAEELLEAQNLFVDGIPTDLRVGDFNNDGSKDLACGNPGAWRVTILLQQAQGGLALGPVLPLDLNASGALAVADFNGDRRDDIAVANASPRSVLVFYQTTTGFSAAQVLTTIGTYPDLLATGDFNGDGRADLACSDGLSYTVTVFYQGAGLPGSGQALTSLVYPLGKQGVAVGDFNGDGRDDLVWANAIAPNGQGSVTFFFQGATGLDVTGRSYPMGLDAYALAAGDLNGDGRLDLACVSKYSNFMAVFYQLQGGLTSMHCTVGNRPERLAIGDLNADGRNDVACVNNGSGDMTLYFQDAAGQLSWTSPVDVGQRSNLIGVADFNSDGRQDVVCANAFSRDVVVFYQQKDGLEQDRTLNSGNEPWGLATGDLNGDGRIELACLNFRLGDAALFCQKADGIERYMGLSTGLVQARGIVCGDFNGDGKTDLACGNNQSASVMVFHQTPGGFAPAVRLSTNGAPGLLVAGDFNGDGKDDLASGQWGTGMATIYYQNGGRLQGPQHIQVGTNPKAMTAGDFNGDGKADLALANYGSNNVSVCYQGTSGLANAVSIAADLHPGDLAVGDFNWDGRVDLACMNEGGTVAVFAIVSSGGAMQRVQTLAAPTYPSKVASGDFNGDGRTDLACAGSTGAGADYRGVVAVFYQTADGLAAGVFLDAGDNPEGLATGDFNGDGREDLACANNGTDDVTVFYQGAQGLTAGQTLPAGAYPRTLATADFNGDGWTDLAAANSQSGDVSFYVQRRFATGLSGVVGPDGLSLGDGTSGFGYGGAVGLAIPAGILPVGTRVAMTPHMQIALPFVSADTYLDPAAPAVRIMWERQGLASPAQLSMTFDGDVPAQLLTADRVRVYRYERENARVVRVESPRAIDAGTRTATVSIDRFGVYQLAVIRDRR